MEKFKDINERLHEFEIEAVLQGKNVKGKFKCKYPSIANTISIEVRMSRILDKASVDTLPTATADLAYMLAYNDTLLIERPDWYNPKYFEDDTIIKDVYMEIYAFANSFRYGNEQEDNSGDSIEPDDGEPVEG